MSTDDLTPLPDDVQALLAAERPLPAVSPALAQELWSGLERAITGMPSASAADASHGQHAADSAGGDAARLADGGTAHLASSVGGSAAQLASSVGGGLAAKAVVAAVALLVGGGTVAVLDRTVLAPAAPEPKVVVREVPVEHAAEPSPAAAEPLAVEPRLPAVVPRTRPPRAAEPSAAGSDRHLAEERVLIERARSALARQSYDDALAATEEHARRFTEGQLAEERESLAVLALRRAGRLDQAAARAAAFERRWPESLLLPAVRGP